MRNASCVVAAAVVAVSVTAAEPAVNLDQTVDVPSIVRSIKEAPLPEELVLSKRTQRHLYWIQGCKEISLAPGQVRSEPVKLTSAEMIEECDIPTSRNPGSCNPTLGSPRSETLRIFIENRPAGAPLEKFELCLDGYQVWVKVLESPYRYSDRRQGDSVILSPAAAR